MYHLHYWLTALGTARLFLLPRVDGTSITEAWQRIKSTKERRFSLAFNSVQLSIEFNSSSVLSAQFSLRIKHIIHHKTNEAKATNGPR
jgi:hypothetical protein